MPRLIAQLPSTCAFGSMPRAAIGTGSADAVLRPEEIGEALQLALAQQRARVDGGSWDEPFLSPN
jgi:chemotaxis response regulator CheB